MGGNALKNCVTRRYEADEYHSLEREVYSKLIDCFPDSVFNTIKAYNNKSSFGDMDILICHGDGTIGTEIISQIEKYFNPKEILTNHNVLSFEYKEFQIDLINCKAQEYHSSFQYFSYNDLGNLVGRLAHSMGLKLGHDGLSYNWRVDTYQFKNEIISTDWKVICNVLGLDYEQYCKGFDELEDIFKFVVASPIFHADIYHLENRNNYARTRDKKRKIYTEFLEWIKNYKHTPEQQARRNYIKSDNYKKDQWLPYLFLEIPNFEETYNRVQKEWQEETDYKTKFNGDIVKGLTKLDNKELGMFMKYINIVFDKNTLKHFILKANEQEIENFIMQTFIKYESVGV